MYQPPLVYHLLTDAGHCAKFTINYNGDRDALMNTKMLGEYKFIGNVVGGSPIYERIVEEVNRFNIYKEFRRQNPNENTWRGAVILFTLLYISFTFRILYASLRWLSNVFFLFQLEMRDDSVFALARIVCAEEKVTDCNHDWSFLKNDDRTWTTDYDNVEFQCNYII